MWECDEAELPEEDPFVVDTGAAEEAAAEPAEVVAEDVPEAAPAEPEPEAAAQAEPEPPAADEQPEEAVAVEVEAAVVAEVVVVVEATAEDDGWYFDTVGDPEEEEVAATSGGSQNGSSENLFGKSVAASFLIDVDEEPTDAEPPAKKARQDVPAAKALDAGAKPPFGAAPPSGFMAPSAKFKPPSTKWSGPKPPTAPPPGEKSHLLQRIVPKVVAAAVGRPPLQARPTGPVPKAHLPLPGQRPVGPAGKAPALMPQRHAPMAVRPPVRPPVMRPGLPAKASAPVAGGGTPSVSRTVSSDSLSQDSGYVFICNNGTEREVAMKKLFGSPDREMAQMREHIKPDTQLFLLNFESLKMTGPFAPDGVPEMNVIRGAFGGRFNAQLRVLPTDKMVETQLEKKVPSGPKDAAGMKVIASFLERGSPMPPNLLQLWRGVAGAVPTPLAIRPTFQARPHAGLQMMVPHGMPAHGHGVIDRNKPGPDQLGRDYKLNEVVVNFANVGASYASKVLGKVKGDRLFDWEGVRKCINHLTKEKGLKVVGCVFENYFGPDRGGPQVPIPADIRQMCSSIQETPSLTGRNHKSADDEMTIKCAYHRNCRFLDNDNYRDWLRELRDNKVRDWLTNCQEMLQMRYFFDTELGRFDTLDGNIPYGLLSPEARQMGT